MPTGSNATAVKKDAPIIAAIARQAVLLNVAVFTLIESPELLVEPVLGFERDGDDVGGLALAPSIQDEIGAAAMPVVPGGLDEEATGVGIAGLGNGTSAISFPGGSFGGNEAEVRHQRSR